MTDARMKKNEASTTVDRLNTAPLIGETQHDNRVTLAKLLLIVPVMLLFCASLVPLYKQICAVLGITSQRALVQNTQTDLSRLVKVDFIAHLNNTFAWNFEPVEKHVEVHPGAVVTVNYRVTNTLPYATTGRAVPSPWPSRWWI